ncbi:LacI family transcriptional regulator [Curtobacterium pusillum]|uniref:LacI family transcriptional regulator n=1 Tax=Curtobacterium pusillum TaxID=69373 RepID=A0AAW3SYA9_9MICO|nr:LacI family DNA-binding transcriptional regulator [Curtobacterium pusillum]MBA8988871.1 LacI family transcriptional regulator [Curtobacterium pusillum]
MPRASEIGFAAVAKLAGVSAATVSNTLNRPDIVSPATRERVLDAIDQLDFVPNRAAAALRQGTSKLLGLVIPDVVNPFYSAITRGVTEAAAARGYVVALCVSHDDVDQELAHFGHLAELRAAGAIVVPLTADPSRVRRLRMVGARLVLVDRSTSVDEGCSVAIDDVHGGHLAVDHLLDTRPGRIVLVNGARSIPQCEDRRTGARSALEDRGFDPDALVEVTVDAMTIEAGTAVGASLAADAPDAVFCTNDQLAVGVMRGLTRAGVRVPEDVAVIGYGDLELARDSLVPLTSIAQPKDELGRAAVEQLIAEIETPADEHVHTAATFEPTLVVRSSAP